MKIRLALLLRRPDRQKRRRLSHRRVGRRRPRQRQARTGADYGPGYYAAFVVDPDGCGSRRIAAEPAIRGQKLKREVNSMAWL